MGIFSLINDLLDENSGNSLEKKVVGAIDKLEDTLSSTLDKTETSVQQANKTVEKLESSTRLISQKLTTATNAASKSIDGIQKKI